MVYFTKLHSRRRTNIQLLRERGMTLISFAIIIEIEKPTVKRGNYSNAYQRLALWITCKTKNDVRWFSDKKIPQMLLTNRFS